MKEKRESTNWYIAATHWLTTGLLLALVWWIPVAIIINKDTPIFIVMGMKILWILTIWPGVIYSAKHLSKTYIIKNSGSIVNLSTFYSCIVPAFLLYAGSLSFVDFMFSVVGIVAFYILSKKYVKNDDEFAKVQ